MAVTRRPKKEVKKAEDKVEALIMRGESSGRKVTKAVEPQSDEETIKRVQLRVPLTKLGEIDKATKSRPGKLSRHTWIMEAIEEKLERDLK